MMRLVRDEQDMLEGKEGLAKQKAMELLVKYAEGLGADRFVDTNNVTIIVGCFMDTTAALIILVPIFAPIASQFGIHPLHFGLVFSLNLIIGLATPPVGLCLFVVCGISKISLERISKEIWPFILIEVGVLLLITYVPAIPMALPKLFGYY
jgi:TRAP-type C4-dicarboxylate transport system permease large subunit